MIFGSVCSGIEAASVAWAPLGWRAAWLSEIEKFPSAVLAHHYPDVPNLGDMTRLSEREEYHGRSIDLLAGGTPCQSFSIAGFRKSLDDPRGNLMLTYLAIAREKRPRWLVWENVPGVLRTHDNAFGKLLWGLGELGYGFAYRVLDAQYAGVPQRRRRVFVVGHLGDWRRAAAVLFERHSLQGNTPPSRKEGQKITPTLVARTTGGGGLGCDFEAGGGLVAVSAAFGVRRLTPRECERLQGFPDDYTLVPYRKGMSADGPRYKSLGNSWAVPVARWVGERIAIVDAISTAREPA